MCSVSEGVILGQRSGFDNIFAGGQMPPEVMIVYTGLEERNEKEEEEGEHSQEFYYCSESYGTVLHKLYLHHQSLYRLSILMESIVKDKEYGVNGCGFRWR